MNPKVQTSPGLVRSEFSDFYHCFGLVRSTCGVQVNWSWSGPVHWNLSPFCRHTVLYFTTACFQNRTHGGFNPCCKLPAASPRWSESHGGLYAWVAQQQNVVRERQTKRGKLALSGRSFGCTSLVGTLWIRFRYTVSGKTWSQAPF